MAELVMSFKKNPERKCIVTPCFITATRDFYNEEKVPLPEEFVIGAIWDTGATTSAISKGVIDFLGLQPTGKKDVFRALTARTNRTLISSTFIRNRPRKPLSLQLRG